MSELFGDVAEHLFDLGYQPIPLRGKVPCVSEWQKIPITSELVSHWATNGQAECNVGLRTGQGENALYACDIDVLDLDVSRAIRDSFSRRFGAGVLRVGRAPKVLMVYRGIPGKKKINSATWRDPSGTAHKVELLGSGQQFMATGVHPDTGKQIGRAHV